tara:strand:- start:722 stop:1351 length:630 start_codon:yes stop_codon:yes gene_type:complete
MSWAINYKKYKSLVTKVLSVNSELDFATEVVDEYEKAFREYQSAYCAKNSIDIEDLLATNEKKIEQLVNQHPLEDKLEPVESDAPRKTKKESRAFTGLYKLIAKKIHPDKYHNHPDKEEALKMEALFKKAGTALASGDWAALLDIAHSLNIKPLNLKEMNKQIQSEIVLLEVKVGSKKNRYNFHFYECGDDEQCKEELMRLYMQQVFNL